MSSPHDYDIKFDFVRFIEFLKDHNVISVIIAAILSDRINEITNILFDQIIMPIINRDADGDGVRDIKKFEEYQLEVHGAKFGIGKITISLLKFFIITYIIFTLSNIMKVKL